MFSQYIGVFIGLKSSTTHQRVTRRERVNRWKELIEINSASDVSNCVKQSTSSILLQPVSALQMFVWIKSADLFFLVSSFLLLLQSALSLRMGTHTYTHVYTHTRVHTHQSSRLLLLLHLQANILSTSLTLFSTLVFIFLMFATSQRYRWSYFCPLPALYSASSWYGAINLTRLREVQRVNVSNQH